MPMVDVQEMEVVVLDERIMPSSTRTTLGPRTAADVARFETVEGVRIDSMSYDGHGDYERVEAGDMTEQTAEQR